VEHHDQASAPLEHTGDFLLYLCNVRDMVEDAMGGPRLMERPEESATRPEGSSTDVCPGNRSHPGAANGALPAGRLSAYSGLTVDDLPPPKPRATPTTAPAASATITMIFVLSLF
jgi:hypothetical protein